MVPSTDLQIRPDCDNVRPVQHAWSTGFHLSVGRREELGSPIHKGLESKHANTSRTLDRPELPA